MCSRFVDSIAWSPAVVLYRRKQDLYIVDVRHERASPN